MHGGVWKLGLGLKKSVTPSNKHGLTNFPEAYAVQLPSGDMIYVSQPQIDKVSLLGDVPAFVFGQEPLSPKSVSWFGKMLKDGLKTHGMRLQKASSASSFAKGYPKKGVIYAFVKLGPRGTRVDLAAIPVSAPDGMITGWKLRLEWNPRKAGKDATEQLHEILLSELLLKSEGASEWFRSAMLTRLDIAVDVLGAERPNIYVRLPEQKKLMSYSGWSSGLQTTNHYLSEVKSGSANISVYDKRQEQIDKKGKNAPLKFGNLPHVRIERRLKGVFNMHIQVAELLGQPNLLKGPIVRLLRDVPDGPSKADQQIVAGATLWLGWNALSKALKGPQLEAWKMMKTEHDPDFWDTARLWKYWPEAIDAAGLAAFVNKPLSEGQRSSSKGA